MSHARPRRGRHVPAMTQEQGFQRLSPTAKIAQPPAPQDTLLSVENLSVAFTQGGKTQLAVDNVSHVPIAWLVSVSFLRTLPRRRLMSCAEWAPTGWG